MFAVGRAGPEDAEAIMALQKLAYQSEARIYYDWFLPPLVQSIDSLLAEFENSVVLKAISAGRIVGSVRAKAVLNVCEIGRLAVHPDLQGQGIGSRSLQEIEAFFVGVGSYALFTGSRSAGNLRLLSTPRLPV